MPGLYWDEFDVGQVFDTPARTVTEADVAAFAGLSGDYNPLHTDVEYCKETPFGERIAHGLLGLAFVSGLKARLGIMDGTTLAFLGINWSFKAPIRFGDTVHARITISDKRATSKPDRGVVVQSIELVNQRGEVVQCGEHTLLMRRKSD